MSKPSFARCGHGKEWNAMTITERERDVLALAADGHTFATMAAQLFVAPDTARKHAASAYRKLGARSMTHAVAEALRRGMIE